ncbi:MAG: DUF1254 domain-containing protein, partial [Chloroflexota bacterium]
MTDSLPRMRMTTEVPDGILTPDRVESPIGTLSFRDGVPDEKTARMVYDNLDLQRAVQAYLASIQIASMSAMRRGLLGFGPANQTAVLFETLMDSRTLFLTANTSSVYMMAWLDASEGPVVIETPPNVLGIVDDMWFRYVTDFGNAGPDAGKGGKYLILPPGYDGDVPDGYHLVRSATYGNWVIWRGFLVHGDPSPAVEETKRLFRMYPLSQAASPAAMNFINVSGADFSTIHAADERFFDEVNEVIQTEPPDGQSPEILGQLAAIGMRKGQPFEPDARMSGILAQAAAIANATARTLAARPREDAFNLYPGESHWTTPFV